MFAPQPTHRRFDRSDEWAALVLRIGLVVVFGVFGVDKWIHPLLWISWLPAWMDGLFGYSRDLWLEAIGATEGAIALLLLLPVYSLRKLGSALAILHLIGVLSQMHLYIPGLGFDQIAIRDLGLLSAAAALFLLT